jgi:hypothetical protein
MSLKVYSLAKGCELSVGGIPIKEGLVSFAIAPEGDRFGDDVSADGMVTRWDTGEVRHNATLILKGASSENEKLSAIHAVDVSVGNGAGVVTLSFTDEQGATKILTPAAWIKSMPTMTRGTNPEDVSWAIRCVLDVPEQLIVGGN